MRAFAFAALATAVVTVPAGAQFHGGTPLERAAAAYGECVYREGRSAKQGGASADSAVEGAFKRCKGQRKRALNATRSRLVAAGMAGATAKSAAESTIASGDRMMADSLRQEFAGASAAAPE